MYNRPYKLKNGIQNYAWGKKGSSSAIPEIFGFSPDEDKPYAELWIGTHPKLPSFVESENGLVALSDFIKSQPEKILGAEVTAKYGNNLPYLLKVLSIGKALSIQTHPDKEAARDLHKLAPDKYPDENHKPEIAIALTGLNAVVGLREKSGINEIIKSYPGLEMILDDLTKDALKDHEIPFDDSDRDRIYRSLLFAENDLLKKVIDQLKSGFESRKKLSFIEQTFLTEFDEYGYDPGLLALFFFNLIDLKKGEAFFTPSGVPHAYLGGDIVECMATSDNVIRAGLTPKYKDIDTLFNILDRSFSTPGIMEPCETNITRYNTPAEEFCLTRIIGSEQQNIVKSAKDKIVTFLLISGELGISCNDTKYDFEAGDTFVIPAALGEFTLSLAANSELFMVEIP